MVNAPVINDLRRALVAEAHRLGFVAVGFAPARLPRERAQALDAWLAEGRHGSMDWMHSRAEQRGSPEALWADVRSVISLGMSYAPPADPRSLLAHPGHAAISTYAKGRDYHDTVKKALKALARWLVAEAGAAGLANPQLKVFVDTAPVLEKPLAQAAGLGWQGKHTNLVSRTDGSWLLLGEIFTTLPFDPDDAGTDRCGSCRACQDACPTDAFPQPYQLDARRCISYLTIEHKGPIPIEFRRAMGNRIYGCDDCLAACPWNKFAATARTHRDFLPRAELAAPALADLLTLDDAGFRQLFSGSPIKRIGRDRFIRNCLTAAGNSSDVALLALAEPLCADPDPVVAEAARWAVDQLRQAP